MRKSFKDGHITVVGIKPGHDGAIALLENGELAFSIEAEKDSNPRFSPASAHLMLSAFEHLKIAPDVIALSGWEQGKHKVGSGYRGIDEQLAQHREATLFGTNIAIFSSTHERSHVFCSYGLSPFKQGQPCYVLIWEGYIGAFYEVDELLRIRQIACVMSAPGYKYSFAFDLANPNCRAGGWHFDSAGKLMALAAFSSRTRMNADEDATAQFILQSVKPPSTAKDDLSWCKYLNCGVTDPCFMEFAGKFSDLIFSVFFDHARRELTKGYPLLIAGGCGLNCEWNSRWRDSGLFADVFVPPVTSDCGSAIGTAIEAQYYETGNAKIQWSVYAGLEFLWDRNPDVSRICQLDYAFLAERLLRGDVVAWVQGKYEIGPRALGNRSLLAAPFESRTRDRLNSMKLREAYRPIAPVCLEEDANCLFGLHGPSPYMLYLQRVLAPTLKAVTHVDGSARVQTVSKQQNPRLYQLLAAFKQLTGYGVLCNTSLNLPGRGFINRSSDLLTYAENTGIDMCVVEDRMFACQSATNLCDRKSPIDRRKQVTQSAPR